MSFALLFIAAALICLGGSIFFLRKAVALLKKEPATSGESSQGFVIANYALGPLVAYAALILDNILAGSITAYNNISMGAWAVQMVLSLVFYEMLYRVVRKKPKYDLFPETYWQLISRSGAYGSLAAWFAIVSVIWDIQ